VVSNNNINNNNNNNNNNNKLCLKVEPKWFSQYREAFVTGLLRNLGSNMVRDKRYIPSPQRPDRS
jgi:hypothetical protein